MADNTGYLAKIPFQKLPAQPADLHPGAQWRYARGCRCSAETRPDGSPGCREAWREYRRDRVAAYRARKRAEAKAAQS